MSDSGLLIEIMGRTLADCEQVIRRGLATFVEVGEALMVIRDNRLYREKGYTRFEDYCQEVWGWSRDYAFLQIQATQVTALLSSADHGRQIPSNERQARELAPLMRQDEAAMVETWRDLREQYGDRVTAAKVKDAVGRKLKQEVAREREPEPVVTPAMPDGKYRCIVIDPPWPVQKIEREERPNQGVTLDYPVMSLEEIGALPIADLAEPSGCHVYLWVTQKFLPAGLDLFRAWGVAYQCLMTWVKNVGFTPFSFMYSTEHILFDHVGNLRLLQMGLRLDFTAPTTGHSRKPDVFYDLVRAVSPEPRLEMFSRQQREGFTAWGSEV